MLELIKEYNLDKFDVKVYKETESEDTINLEQLELLTQILNDQFYPRSIVELLEVIEGIKQIVVSNKNNRIILISANSL